MANDAAVELAIVLAAEHRVLRQGVLADLPGIAIRKEALLSRLSATGTALPQWRHLIALAHENQRLIGAALKGVHAARLRLQAMRSAAEGTCIYTAQGSSVGLDKAPSGIERRA